MVRSKNGCGCYWRALRCLSSTHYRASKKRTLWKGSVWSCDLCLMWRHCWRYQVAFLWHGINHGSVDLAASFSEENSVALTFMFISYRGSSPGSSPSKRSRGLEVGNHEELSCLYPVSLCMSVRRARISTVSTLLIQQKGINFCTYNNFWVSTLQGTCSSDT